MDMKVKIETVTSSSDIKPEIEDSPCSENEEHYILGFNETIRESEIETKVHIKEEYCWLKSEDSCINDCIKDETHEDFYSTKPLSSYKEVVSSYTSGLSCTEGLGNVICFNMKQDSPECESIRKHQIQEPVIADISAIEKNVCSGSSENCKIVNMASSLEQNKLFQQNTDKQEINDNCKSTFSYECGESYEDDVSKKCFNYSSHLNQCRLVPDSKKVNTHKCDILKKDLNPSLKTHKLIDKKTHKCNICYQTFTQLSDMRKHKLIHKGIKPHKCNICNKSFTQLSNLKTHRSVHEGIKPHKCNICNKAFVELSKLKRHTLVHENVKPHKCSICTKAFTDLSNLKAHKLIHEGIKPHKCNICDKAFTKLSNLKTHKLVHEGIKPYKCNICNKAFIKLSNLKTHKLIHEGIKPHKCNSCSKAFTVFSKLKRHKLVHEGVKPHQCDICNKAFTALSHLKTHKLIHEGIRPHKCSICNKAFTVLSHLKTHKLAHEGIKPHKCNICNKAFTKLSNLKRHTLTH